MEALTRDWQLPFQRGVDTARHMQQSPPPWWQNAPSWQGAADFCNAFERPWYWLPASAFSRGDLLRLL
jgi:hypothetical protein